MGTAVDIKERLTICANLLNEIDRHRASTGDAGRGSGIERRIIDRELREIEEDIFNDPGALAAQLVRLRHP